MSLKLIVHHLAGLVAPMMNSNQVYLACHQELRASTTANKVFSKLNGAFQTVNVLIVDQEVDSMYIPPFRCDGGGAYNGGIAVLNATNPLQIGDVTLPLGVSLIHELGHAVQYVTDPQGFQAKFEIAQSGANGSTKFNILSAQGKALTKYLKNTTINQLLIENENVANHEAPVCDELGLPFRKKYS